VLGYLNVSLRHLYLDIDYRPAYKLYAQLLASNVQAAGHYDSWSAFVDLLQQLILTNDKRVIEKVHAGLQALLVYFHCGYVLSHVVQPRLVNVVASLLSNDELRVSAIKLLLLMTFGKGWRRRFVKLTKQQWCSIQIKGALPIYRVNNDEPGSRKDDMLCWLVRCVDGAVLKNINEEDWRDYQNYVVDESGSTQQRILLSDCRRVLFPPADAIRIKPSKLEACVTPEKLKHSNSL